MDVAGALVDLELPQDTMVHLSYEGYEEVFHCHDDYHEIVIASTNIIQQLAVLLARFGNDVYHYGSSVLEQLREAGYLASYTSDENLDSYLEEVLYEHYYDLECIEFTTTTYDHKRGRCTVEAQVEIPVGSLLGALPALEGWKAWVRTPHGVLMIG